MSTSSPARPRPAGDRRLPGVTGRLLPHPVLRLLRQPLPRLLPRSSPRPLLRVLGGLAVLAAVASSAACGAGPGGVATATVSPEPGAPVRPGGTTTIPGRPTTGGPAAATPGASAASARPDELAATARPTGTAPVEVERDRGEPTLVTGVRTGRHDGFDRVVVDVKGGLPGYTVRWVDELQQDGSGKPLALRGHPCLYVLLTPAEAHTEDGTPTWTGTPIDQPLGNVTGILKAGDFEGRVSIGIVAASKTPFRVREYTRPDRLVIDVAH
ncbi:hypothetical protein MTP10_07680 [Nonomuraea sp. 3-1Str]|uniref:AMIN-like domain-containing (lipo)protein n=1 Tax=Nonomuraea sp. 3-1Str TaxID=2929801 RepID=UPI0028641772|nr:hypothetical protein [Nonomuraea sp. 3-1Str]MDR8408615.1 hypothetical protein [Nonomuraea sp. 3-1Str]